MEHLKYKYLIVLTGPTAVGKSSVLMELTDLTVPFALSADSRQVYREMSIGTAKPTSAEIEATGLQLVGHVSIHEKYNTGMYEAEAIALLHSHYKTNDLAFISGGTGLYIKAVTEGLDHFPEVNPSVLEQLQTEFDAGGLQPHISELEEKDPSYANVCDLNNPRRVHRALSIIRQTGRPFSDFLNQEKDPRPFRVINCILDRPRKELYRRIDKRVLNMMEAGLEQEARDLYPYRNLRALQTVGYSELFDYFEGKRSLHDTIGEIQKNTRRYAKRQMTWFKKYISGERFYPENVEGIYKYIKENLE